MDASKSLELNYFSFKISFPTQTPSEIPEALVEEIKSRFVDGFSGTYEEVDVDTLETKSCTVYFESLDQAARCSHWIQSTTNFECTTPEKQEDKDWNEAWSKAFEGIEIDNLWKVIPASKYLGSSEPREGWPKTIVLTMGAGFGTGTHETTRLCLEALAMFGTLASKKVLDFGSGSGILSIAASLMGARQVDAVEIDTSAIQSASENMRLNSVQVNQYTSLASVDDHSCDVIVANILAPVLVEHATSLSAKLIDDGVLILSGLLESDVDEVVAVYQGAIGPSHRAQVVVQNEWARVMFRPVL